MIEKATIEFSRAEADKLIGILHSATKIFGLQDGGVMAQDAIVLFKKIDSAFSPQIIEPKPDEVSRILEAR